MGQNESFQFSSPHLSTFHRSIVAYKIFSSKAYWSMFTAFHRFMKFFEQKFLNIRFDFWLKIELFWQKSWSLVDDNLWSWFHLNKNFTWRAWLKILLADLSEAKVDQVDNLITSTSWKSQTALMTRVVR